MLSIVMLNKIMLLWSFPLELFAISGCGLDDPPPVKMNAFMQAHGWVVV